jgi:phosphoenolpyruvate carboxylase
LSGICRWFATAYSEHGGERIASGGLRDLIRQAEIFGFHLAKLDVRQESSVIVRTVANSWPRTRAKIWSE